MTEPLISTRHSTMGFDSDSFVQNFLKYLMSTSRNHTETSDTKRNLVVEYIDGGLAPKVARIYYNDNAGKRTRALLAQWKNNPRPCTTLLQDLTYLSFVVPVGRRAVSNFLCARREKGQIFIDVSNPHAASWCLEDMFEGSQSRFERGIGRVLDQVDELVTYDNLDQAELFEIDKILHLHVNRVFPGHAPVIAVSHNDQATPFHIHRIMKR